MCFFLSTTSFDFRRPVLKCQHYLGERQARLVISPRSPPRWVICRNELHQPTKDQLRRSKQSMFQRTISQTLRRQTLLRTWTQPSCLSAQLLSSEFIPLLIHWLPRRKHSPRRLLAKIITTSRETCSEYCNDTKIFRTSSLFLEWMN